MGCCPSKSRAQRDAHYDASCNELADALDVQATTTTAFVDSSIVDSTSPSSTNRQSDAASAALLMDRGDGTLLVKSDSDPTPSSPPSALEPRRSPSDSSAAVSDESSTATTKSAANVTENSSSNNNNDNDNSRGSVDASTIGGIRAAEPTAPVGVGASETSTPTSLSLQSSPRKAPVNFDDVPITSMYHRIHVVEAEALDARCQAELQAEAARRELEVREFKAAMQRAP